ncbi:extracellular calcium-sensing receptor [Hydra vulgaris]|uniref:extracellular calcium-sensing receptor n=1 Tax=Hydra vulgaris TaxID=6087 RepID=UPI001F5F965A|nr:extracellular calcium-sensing receptor-like [Hydra vulgaris]
MYLWLFFGLFVLCENCMDINTASAIKGKFTIVGLFPMNCSTSDNINKLTFGWMEALKYTVNEANMFLNNTIFDYVIYDTLDSSNMEKLSFAVLDALLFNNNYACNCSIPNRKLKLGNILGFVGPAESSSSIYVNDLISPFEKIPIISYAATSLELEDKTLFPHFFRTIPPDKYQVLFISDVLKRFGWSYISVVALDNSYGRAGVEQLSQVILKKGICIDHYFTLPETFDKTKYFEIIDKLITSVAKVVVYWGTFKPLQDLLLVTQSRNLTNHTWLISEGAGKNFWFLEFNKMHKNNIFLVVQTEGIDKAFNEYFLSLTYENASEWLKVAFQNYGINETTSDFSLKNISQVFDLSGVSFVQDAAKVLINALLLYQSNFPSNQNDTEFQTINDRAKFIEYVKKISFSILGNTKTFSFDSNQNPQSPAYFELYSADISSFVLAATWSLDNLKITYNETVKFDQIKSICSLPCNSGEKKIASLINSCCWDCVPCSENTVATFPDESCIKCEEENNFFSNLDKSSCVKLKRIYWNFRSNQEIIQQVITIIFSSFGVVTALIFIFTFIKMKLTPIVRSSHYELSLVQMTMHLLMFAITFLAFGEESNMKCIIRIYFGGFLHVFIVAILFVKIIRIVKIFEKSLQYETMTPDEKLYLMTKTAILLVFVPSTYITIIFVVHYSRYAVNVSDVQDMTSFTVQKYCDSISFSTIHLCFLLVLSFFCGIPTFKGRNLPCKFNENKCIAYSLFLSSIVWSVMVGIIQSNLSSTNKTFVYCLLKNLTNFLLLVILFFNKIKIIWIHPEQNTREEFHKNRFKTSLSNDTRCFVLSNKNSDIDESISDEIHFTDNV